MERARRTCQASIGPQPTNPGTRSVIDVDDVTTGSTHPILLTWLRDAANEAIACFLMSRGVQAFTGRLGVEIQRAGRSLDDIEELLGDSGSESAAPTDELLAKASSLSRQKWDKLLSPYLLRQSYESSNLDMDEALAWLRKTF